MSEDKAWWQRPAALMIIAGNLVPLAGVLSFGWQLLAVMLAFWLDSVAIGVFTTARILLARLDSKAASGRSSGMTRVLAAWDFAFQYAFVCVVHGVLVIGLFGLVQEKLVRGTDPEVDVYLLALLRQPETLTAAVAVLLTRGIDFIAGYLQPRAFEQADIGKEQASPYRRAYLLHVVLVLGGAISLALHSPVAALVMLVLLKTGGDLIGENKRYRAATPATPL
jgi:hypothetical protein